MYSRRRDDAKPTNCEAGGSLRCHGTAHANASSDRAPAHPAGNDDSLSIPQTAHRHPLPGLQIGWGGRFQGTLCQCHSLAEDLDLIAGCGDRSNGTGYRVGNRDRTRLQCAIACRGFDRDDLPDIQRFLSRQNAVVGNDGFLIEINLQTVNDHAAEGGNRSDNTGSVVDTGSADPPICNAPRGVAKAREIDR